MASLRTCVVASLALLLASVPLAAQAQQTVEQEVNKALENVKRNNPGLVVKIDPNTGLPSSIKGYRSQAPSAGLGASTAPTEAEVRAVVEALFAQSELTAAFPQKNATAKVEAVKVRRDPDVKGQNIVHVQQRVNGIPVFGSSGRVVVNPSLAVTQLTASFSTVAVETTTPSITQADAIAAARAKLKADLSQRKRDVLLDQLLAKIDEVSAKTELAVFDPALVKARGAAPGPIKLAYLVTIDSFRVFVDAATKDILFTYRDQPSAMLRRVYDLANTETFPGKKLIDEESNERVDALSPDAELAFRNIGIVRDYFFIVHGRNGFDDNDADGPAGGAPLESYVRYGSLANAHWCPAVMKGCPKANVMVYGPNFAGALDIAGHELTHGIIAFEADLIYANESGAVNESIADIFGTLIELKARGDRGNWVMGEGLPERSVENPMRSMSDPGMKDAAGLPRFRPDAAFDPATNGGQPEHFSQYVKPSDPLCETTTDYWSGCVHFNSGIFNKFAYLVAQGGTQKDVAVTGIGATKLARIAYRALTTQLNTSSGLAQSAEAFVQACVDLAASGAAQITDADCVQVDTARTAVGLTTGS